MSYKEPQNSLLYLVQVYPNGNAWNASHDCPLSEHSITIEAYMGQWPQLKEYSNQTVAKTSHKTLLWRHIDTLFPKQIA